MIHSSKDYRLPIAEGLAAFNVLQARGVESKFLTFPDEVSSFFGVFFFFPQPMNDTHTYRLLQNHWVLKPENSLVWHKVVLNWINSYVGLPLAYEGENENQENGGGMIEFLGGVKDDEKKDDVPVAMTG